MGLHIQLALAGVSLALAAGFITNTQDFKKNQLHRESRSNNPDAPDFSSYYPEQTFELEEYMAMKAGKVGKPFSIPPQGLGYNTPSTQINAPQANSEQYFGKQLQTSPLQYDPHGSLVKGNPNKHIPSPHPSKPTNAPLQPALSSDDDFFKGFGESGMFQDDGEWGSDTWGADANSDWMVDPSLAAAQQPTQAAAHPTQAAAHSNPAGSSFKSGQSQGLMPGQNYNPRDFRALMQNPYKPMSHSQFNALNFPIQTMTLDEPAAIPAPAAIAREEVITKEGKQGYPGFTKMEGFLPEHAMHVIENSISGINSNTIEMPSMMDEEKTPKHTPHVYSHEHAHAHKSDHSHGHKHGHEHKAEHKHGHKHEHQVSSSHKHDHKHSSKHGHDHKHGHTHLAEHKHGHNHTSSHGHDHKHEHKAGHKHLHQHKQDHTHGHTHKGEHKHHHVHEHHHHHHHKHSHASEHKHGHDHKHDHKGIY